MGQQRRDRKASRQYVLALTYTYLVAMPKTAWVIQLAAFAFTKRLQQAAVTGVSTDLLRS